MKRPIVAIFVTLGVMVAPITLASLAQLRVEAQVAQAAEGPTISSYQGLHPRPFAHRHRRRRRWGWIWWVVGAVVVIVVVGAIFAGRGRGGGGGGGGGFFFFGGGGCGGCGG